jgi:hypothetical protein
MRSRVAQTSIVLLAVFAFACRPDLGECDPDAAVMVTFANGGPFAGRPSFAGQALVTASCGNERFCHASSAEGVDRYGAPAHLDFDPSVPCADRVGCDERSIERLRENQLSILDRAHSIASAVRSGDMPPGDQGEAAQDPFGYRTGPEASAPLLPEVGSPEGIAILENWLACGAPVVEATTAPTVDSPPGVSCGRGPGAVGECIVRTDLTLPEPTWSSIFENVIEPACGRTCHGPSGVDQREESALDLSATDVAYDALVNAPVEGLACAGTGAASVRVAPGEPDRSLLLMKLESPSPCGDPMPSSTDLLPAVMLDIIRTWIEEGANR